MAIDVVSTENGSTLRARYLVLLFDFFAILLFPVGVLRQLSQLVSELMPVYLLDWIKQDYWRLFDLVEHLWLRLIIQLDHVTERHY